MAFPKAVQANRIPESEEYFKALVTYKLECKHYKRMCDRFKTGTTPAERLAYFEAKERYSQASKNFSLARYTYANAMATAKLREKNPTLSPLEIAAAQQIHIPTSMKDLIADERARAAVAAMSDEQFENIKNAALAYEARKSTREQFMSEPAAEVEKDKDKNDPTLGDFDPL